MNQNKNIVSFNIILQWSGENQISPNSSLLTTVIGNSDLYEAVVFRCTFKLNAIVVFGLTQNHQLLR